MIEPAAPATVSSAAIDPHDLRQRIEQWSLELGFNETRITDLELAPHVEHLQQWLAAGHHGEMDYLATQLPLRAHPASLLANVQRAVVVRMDYLHADTRPVQVLNTPEQAYVSRYALGRDYHRVMRPRLARLANQINRHVGHGGFRACVDSAPVLEKALAERAGLGWFGKNTLILNRHAGSWFFLGVLLTDLPLPLDSPTVREHCGKCSACLDVCPTKAFVGPKQLDARRCISALTIEFAGSSPIELRGLMGNRIFGCDDCQLVCPWNRFAKRPALGEFASQHGLDQVTLLQLFGWSAEDFEQRSRGSPIRRLSYEQWQRNIAVALGNAPASQAIDDALQARAANASALVREHCEWALRNRSGAA